MIDRKGSIDREQEPPREAALRPPCTAASARCADARSYHAVLAPCCRGHLITIMAAVQEACDRHGVRWWADYGTLLGAVRNPLTTKADYPWLDGALLPEGPIPAGIIPHDKDGDLGAFTDDWQGILKVRKDLLELGFDVVLRLHSASIKVRLSATNHTNVDLFTWQLARDGVLHRRTYVSVDAFKGKAFPAAWVDQRTSVPWEGLQLPAPADPVAFCAFRYGDSWATPMPSNHDGVRRD